MRVDKVWQRSADGGFSWVDVAVPDRDPLATAMRNARAGELYVDGDGVRFRFFYVPVETHQHLVDQKPAKATKRTAKKSTKGTKR